VCEPRDEGHGDRRRIWPLAPGPLEGLEGRLDILSIDYVHVPLDDVREVCAAGLERRLVVRQDLVRSVA